MVLSRAIIITGICATTAGCSLFDKSRDETTRLLNPTRIHGALSKDNPAHHAAIIPVADYYDALELAKSTYTPDGPNAGVKHADQAAIKNYVNEGIGLIEVYCRRWFQSLDDLQRLLGYQQQGVNIISQFGTTLLGIGKANSNVVTGYGALNTAYAGFHEAFNAAFLVAPTSSKVRFHIESALKTEADRLREDSKSLNFKQAYNRLESLAGLCTHAQARDIVNSALDKTETKVNDATKQLETTAKTSN